MDNPEIEALNKDSILSNEVIDPLFDIDDAAERERAIQSVRERAKALKVTTAFDNIVKEKKRELAEIRREEKKQTIVDQNGNNITAFDYKNLGIEYRSGKWVADDEGIYTYGQYGQVRASYCPVLISARMINQETGKEKVQISYKRDNSWRDMIVDSGLIASNTRIIQLADYGVPVTSETSRSLVSYLSDFENLNINDIPVNKSTSKLGWIGGEFIPFSADIEFDADGKFRGIFDSIKEHGDKEAWFNLAREIRKAGRNETAVCMAASFGSVLLKLLNISTFIVDIWGESGKGKTVVLMLATSIWADPAISRYITDATSTQTAFEMQQNALNNLPMMVDDFSKTRERYQDQIADVIYMLCGGKGKDRSNRDLGINAATTWKNIVVTNVERPLTDDAMRGGAINRVLDFETQDGYIFSNELGLDRGNYVVSIINENYGFAGKMFVDAVREIGKEKISQIQKDFEAAIRKRAAELGSQKEEKQIIPLAVLMTADKIATDYIFKDGIYIDMDYCIINLKDVGSISENTRAFEYILSAVNINQNKFRPDDDGNYHGEIWGDYKDGYVIIEKNAFEKIAESGNFSAKAFLQWAKKKDIIECSSDRKRNYKKVRLPNAVAPSWCVKMKVDFKGDESENELSENKDNIDEFFPIPEQIKNIF